MLVLSRSEGQRIYIGNDIVLHFVRIGDGKCRIGIDAPKELAIVRDDAVVREVKEVVQS